MTDFGYDKNISMCVYTVTHKESGRVYVGQTLNKAKRRWQAHCSLRSGNGRSAIKAAIAKHGKEAFLFEVIDIAETQEQLDHKEMLWVKTLNTVAPHGYNLANGGCGAGRHTEETRKLISEKVRSAYVKDPSLGKRCARFRVGTHFSDERKKRQSEKIKASHRADPTLSDRKVAHMIGVPRTEDVKAKISATLTGVAHSQERRAAISKGMKPLTVEDRIALARKRYKGNPVIVGGIRFETPFEAELQTGIPAKQLSTAIRRGRQFVRNVPFEVVEK